MTDTATTEDTIRRHLTTITTHWDALLVAPGGAGQGGSRSTLITADDHADTDADIDRATRVVSLRRFATDVLNGWSRVIMEDRPVTEALPDGSNVPSMAAFLVTHAQWMSGHDAAGDLVDELGDVARKVKALAAPKRREWISLGACPVEVEFDPEQGVEVCGGQVRAWPTLADLTREEAAHVRLPSCRRCGTEATVEWWQTHMLGNPAASPLVTATDLIAVVAFSLRWVITHDQIRQWKSRGKIEGAGRDAKGRTLYRHAEVVKAIRADVARQRERRTAGA